MIVDPEETSSSDLYRLLIRSVVPRPIAWVSTISSDGIPNLAPFSFFMAVSADPPTLAFAPGRRVDGAAKHTLENVRDTGEFVVNVVTESLAHPMNASSSEVPAEVDEFTLAGVTAGPSTHVQAPRVVESPINFECRTCDIIDVGSSALVLGTIVMIHVNDSVLKDGKVDPEQLSALGRMGGMDYARTRDRFTLLRPSNGSGTER